MIAHYDAWIVSSYQCPRGREKEREGEREIHSCVYKQDLKFINSSLNIDSSSNPESQRDYSHLCLFLDPSYSLFRVFSHLEFPLLLFAPSNSVPQVNNIKKIILKKGKEKKTKGKQSCRAFSLSEPSAKSSYCCLRLRMIGQVLQSLNFSFFFSFLLLLLLLLLLLFRLFLLLFALEISLTCSISVLGIVLVKY